MKFFDFLEVTICDKVIVLANISDIDGYRLSELELVNNKALRTAFTKKIYLITINIIV